MNPKLTGISSAIDRLEKELDEAMGTHNYADLCDGDTRAAVALLDVYRACKGWVLHQLGKKVSK